jgi:threonine aldolase
VPDAAAFCAALETEGVLMGAMGPATVRAVAHLDVDRAGVETALRAAAGALRA